MTLYRCSVDCNVPVPHMWLGYVEIDSPLDAIDLVHAIAPGPVVLEAISTSAARKVADEWGGRPFLGSNRTLAEWLSA